MPQEEYIKDEMKNLKRELIRAKEEIKRIQSVPLVIGQFNEIIDANYGIVGECPTVWAPSLASKSIAVSLVSMSSAVQLSAVQRLHKYNTPPTFLHFRRFHGGGFCCFPPRSLVHKHYSSTVWPPPECLSSFDAFDSCTKKKQGTTFRVHACCVFVDAYRHRQ